MNKMGKTYKIIVCGKKATGKTSLLEQLIFNNLNFNTNLSSQSGQNRTVNENKYFATIEDIYVACWEKDKGIKEKIRYYDTKGMDSAKDMDTINQMRHLFPLVDGAVLVFSSNDADSIQCIEKLKQEIEKSKDKKEICHFILLDNLCPQTPVNISAASTIDPSTPAPSREQIRYDLQARFRTSLCELNSLDKRDLLCKPFIDLATNITQVPSKGSMNIVQSIKKPKVFSSNK